MNVNRTKQNSTPNIRWMLVRYDLIVYAVVAVILLVLYGGMDKLSTTGILQQVCLSVLCIFVARLIGKVYGQVWRYGGIQCYIRLSIWAGMEIWWDTMLYPAAVYRFYCFCCLSVSGVITSSSKNYICQNAFACLPQSLRGFSTSYDVSLRI